MKFRSRNDREDHRSQFHNATTRDLRTFTANNQGRPALEKNGDANLRLFNARAVASCLATGRWAAIKELAATKAQMLPVRAHQLIERVPIGKSQVDCRQIPVIINSFNRLDAMRELIAWLERIGMKAIYILDNGSTYPPLLRYLAACRHEVIVQPRNLGPYSLWESPVFDRFRRHYYIYTDPDVIPTDECPHDAIEHMYQLLRTYPRYVKVGFGLKIDNLPEHYAKREEVIAWEQQYWTEPIDPGIYRATIDTTFALYRPYSQGGWWLPAIRTGGTYIARHAPWYEDSANPSEESTYYRRFMLDASSHWTPPLTAQTPNSGRINGRSEQSRTARAAEPSSATASSRKLPTP